MRFKGLDLNLLHALDVLLEERSVSRAAQRLRLSQSAVSAALMRLRDYFADPLLEVRGKRMYPTAFATTLQPRVSAFLAGADAVIGAARNFDPALSTRRFRCAASDYAMAAVLADFTIAIAGEAPLVGFDFEPPGERASRLFERGEIDLVLAPEAYLLADHPGECLFEDRHAVLAWESHPLFRPSARSSITEEAVLGHEHVAVAFGESRVLSFGDRHLTRLAPSRRIVATASSFASVPWLLVRTGRLAVVPQRLAAAFVRHMPLRFAPAPFPIPPLREYVQYPRTRQNDEGLVWLVERLNSFLATRQ